MKKTVLLILLIITLASSITYAADCRNTNWGMNKEEVKEIETAKFVKELDEKLAYYVEVAECPAVLLYMFEENKLVQVYYDLTVADQNNNLFIEDYKKLKTLLTQKHGEPIIDEVKWNNPILNYQKEQYGIAIAMGQLQYTTEWRIEGTIIELWLGGENNEIGFYISYSSERYWEQEKGNNNKANELTGNQA